MSREQQAAVVEALPMPVEAERHYRRLPALLEG
jgi:hypothetical protein